MHHEKSAPVAGRWVPTTRIQLLRACPNCGAAHPRARKLDQDVCECGTPSSTGAPITVKAEGNIWLIIANGLQWVANQLIRLSERL